MESPDCEPRRQKGNARATAQPVWLARTHKTTQHIPAIVSAADAKIVALMSAPFVSVVWVQS